MTSRAEYLKLWREKNREKVKAYKAKHYQENKAIICEKRKKYYADNSKIILQKQAEKPDVQVYQRGYRDCACGKTLKISSFYLHRKDWCPLTKVLETKDTKKISEHHKIEPKNKSKLH